MSNIKQRVQKLESAVSDIDNTAFHAWLKSLSLNELEDVLARMEIEIELGIKPPEPWHPHYVEPQSSPYSSMSLEELWVEIKRINERCPRPEPDFEQLRQKWRDFYALQKQ